MKKKKKKTKKKKQQPAATRSHTRTNKQTKKNLYWLRTVSSKNYQGMGSKLDLTGAKLSRSVQLLLKNTNDYSARIDVPLTRLIMHMRTALKQTSHQTWATLWENVFSACALNKTKSEDTQQMPKVRSTTFLR